MILLLSYICFLIFAFENALVSKKPKMGDRRWKLLLKEGEEIVEKHKQQRSENVNWKLVEEMFGPEEYWESTASSFAAGINNRNTFDKAR